jgi:hypothetical protein
MNFKRFGNLSAFALVGIATLFLLNNSCKHDGLPADQMQQICFTDQVLPIFQNSCGTTGCHGGGHGNGYNFTDYKGIMEAISAGNASKSKAYQAMTSTFQLMPPNNALPESKRTIIRIWIEQGAKQTTCGSN